MTNKISILTLISMLLAFVSCSGQKTTNEHSDTPSEVPAPLALKPAEPHQYGGWYCPDNFGFVPVDIQQLDQVPVIANRLPTEQELKDNMSLIHVDTEKYPDARALPMELPRVARIYSDQNKMVELVIVIQAIVVQKDTVVGYRFPNGGNGSARMRDVSFLSKDEVAAMGPQPFFYSKSVLKASPKDIWGALRKTDYFKQLGEKFDEKVFFGSDWNPLSEVVLNLDADGEKVKGYVGMVFGNFYLHIDYLRGGFHYSEKMLLMENRGENTTQFFFASGPYPKGFEKQQSALEAWVETVRKNSEAH